MVYKFYKVISIMMCAVVLLFTPKSGIKSYDVKEPEECLFNFNVFSDVHVEANNTARYRVFVRSLFDTKKNKSGSDALVFLGDNTMNGQVLEDLLFYGTVANARIKSPVYEVMGNHDSGNGEGDCAALLERSINFRNQFGYGEGDKSYFYTVNQGYYFIILGYDIDENNELVFKDEMITWLISVLDEATKGEKPVFLFSHYPVSYYETDNYYLPDILRGYSNIFCFNGHTHAPFYYRQIGSGVYTVNLPRITELWGEKDNKITESTGFGLEVEVYKTELIMRERNFYSGEWVEDGEHVYQLEYPLS